MPDILQDLSPANLIKAIEENLSSWIPLFGRIWESREDDPPGVKRAISNIPVPLFNSIMDARLTPENVETTIRYLLSDAERRNMPLLWWVGPSTQPTDLGKYLQQCGFAIDDDGPGMAVHLEKLNEDLSIPEGFSIQAVGDDENQQEWCHIMAQGFQIPESKLEFVVNSWHYMLSRVSPDTTIAFTGYLDGKPVATSLLQLGGGVAGIYGVATIPEARRKGVGAQVTLYPLIQARAMGFKAGILQASEMGFSMYRSLGFQEYCRITSYVWRPRL